MLVNGGFPDLERYSDLQVMQSGAGYYVGTSYRDPKMPFDEPGSRDSGYFENRKDAELFLQAIEMLPWEDASTLLRQHP